MLSGDMAGIAPAVHNDRICAEARLRIYRNHFTVTLTEALAATYPVVHRLVGAPFFAQAARRYVAAFPPTEPCLFGYGAGYSAFLADCPEAPYLADVARFEWALNRVFHAPDGPTLDARSLATLPGDALLALTLRLDGACALFESPYPVTRIWQINQPDADPQAIVDLAEGGDRLLVCRIDDEAVWRRVEPAEFAFLAALIAGRSLGHANAAAAACGDFDLTTALAALLEARLIAGFTPHPTNQ
jgi:hypothetical protein